MLQTFASRLRLVAVRAALLGATVYHLAERQSKTNQTSRLLSSSQPHVGPREFFSNSQSLAKYFTLLRGYLLVSGLLRHLAILLLQLDPLSSWRWLDCLLIGRYRFIGRTQQIDSMMVLAIAISQALYRYYARFTWPNMNFNCLEFLIHEERQVLEEEREFRKLESKQAQLKGGNDDDHHHHHHLGPQKRVVWSPIFYLFDEQLNTRAQPLQMRLNRTRSCWLKLDLFAKLSLAGILLTSLLWFSLIGFVISGWLLTNRGFEASYSQCASYIRSLRSNSSASSQLQLYQTLIHSPGQPVDLAELPFKPELDGSDSIRLNAYHLLRILLDFGENIFWHMDLFFAYSFSTFIDFAYALDILFNCSAIRQRLDQLLHRLRTEIGKQQQQQQPQQPQQPQPLLLAPMPSIVSRRRLARASANKKPGAHKVALAPTLERLCLRDHPSHLLDPNQAEVEKLQTLLWDHLKLTRLYGVHASACDLTTLALYFGSTLIICLWWIRNGSQIFRVEFLSVEIFSLFACSGFLLSAALVHSANLRLYPSLASAMALDPELGTTKLGWSKLMDMYRPKSLFCFTILDSNELSFLFMLKVSVSLF